MISIILLGFRYLASSIPLISLTGVAVGVGIIFASLVFSISRNPTISNILIRWSFIGFSLVEVSGFIGLVYAFLIIYALVTNIPWLPLVTIDHWLPIVYSLLINGYQ